MWVTRMIRGKAAIELQPFRTKAKQPCLEDASGELPHEGGSERVNHRAECRDQRETFAPVPSFLQGHTSNNRVSSGFLVA